MWPIHLHVVYLFIFVPSSAEPMIFLPNDAIMINYIYFSIAPSITFLEKES